MMYQTNLCTYPYQTLGCEVINVTAHKINMSFYTSTLHLFKQQLSTHDPMHKIDNKYMGENIAVQECALSASTFITTSSSVRNNGMWRMKDKTIAVKWRFCSVSFLQISIEGQHTHVRIIFTGILYSTYTHVPPCQVTC